MPAVGCYRATLGVGTGNCDAEMLLSSLGSLPTVSVSELDMCEPIDLGAVPLSGACTGTAEASAQLTDSGPQGGSLDVDANCPAAGGMCQHAFSLSFRSVDCASVASP